MSSLGRDPPEALSQRMPHQDTATGRGENNCLAETRWNVSHTVASLHRPRSLTLNLIWKKSYIRVVAGESKGMVMYPLTAVAIVL